LETFQTTMGVKQGGPLSSKLFSIYMEDLINQINESNLGIKLGNKHLGVVLYADDILLLSETKINMQKMLKIVETYGKDWEIKFNPDKTKFLFFEKKAYNKMQKKFKKLKTRIKVIIIIYYLTVNRLNEYER
jgi:hypothetical protein